MKKILFLILLLLPLAAQAKQVAKIVSPNKAVTATVHENNGKITMTVLSGKKAAFESIPLGIVTSERDFSGSLAVKGNSGKHYISDYYTMSTGKRIICSNEANARTLWLRNEKDDELFVEIRAYNDGVTFRYILPKPQQDETLSDELTTYPIREGVNRWLQIYHPDSYEDFYPLYTTGINDGNVNQGFFRNQHHLWGYPALVEPHDGIFALVTEANIERNHCGSLLSNAGNENLPKLTDTNCLHNSKEPIGQPVPYKVQLGDDKAPLLPSKRHVASSPLPVNGAGDVWLSPWRVIILGSLSTVVESTLVTDVSDAPSSQDEVKAVQGGVASWIYWAYNHGSQDGNLINKYTDLAAEMHWPYTLIDAEWDVMKNGTIEDAVKYALGKGIKPMIWYNSDANWTGSSAPTPQGRIDTPEKMDKEFAWLKKIGVVGIKVDFFKNDNTWSMNKYLDLLEMSKKHGLMIVFHGCTIPRGWQRTYPHLMTCEAVYGAEWYNNNATLTKKAAAHNATLPFTRNVVGSMDYTPGTFTDSQNPHITTHCHELALPILFESGIQHMPDRPESYRSLPEEVKELLSTLPTVWDDTKLLSGYPGKYVVMARKKGDKWYIAGINGTDEAQTIEFSLNRLFGKKATIVEAQTFRDGKEASSFNISFDMGEYSNQSKITVPTLPRGGFVMILNSEL